MFLINLLASSYPIYFWNKSAPMLGGITGPYLAYLKDGPSTGLKLTGLHVIFSVLASAFYLTIVLLGVTVSQKFGKLHWESQSPTASSSWS